MSLGGKNVNFCHFCHLKIRIIEVAKVLRKHVSFVVCVFCCTSVLRKYVSFEKYYGNTCLLKNVTEIRVFCCTKRSVVDFLVGKRSVVDFLGGKSVTETCVFCCTCLLLQLRTCYKAFLMCV